MWDSSQSWRRTTAITSGTRRPGSSAKKKTTTVEIVDLRWRRDDDLVRAFHRTVYSAAFPIASERESVRTWLSLLSGADSSCELHFLVAGRDLDDRHRRQLLGGHLFEYYPESGCGLLTYLVTHPAYRGRGLATKLFAQGIATLKATARRHRRRLQLVFVEVNDPRKIRRRADVMDPWARLRFFERLGGRVMDLPYVQPELEPGQGAARDLLLLTVFPRFARRDAIAARPVRLFLHEFYRAVNIARPELDADFQAMMTAMRSNRITFTRVRRADRAGSSALGD